MTGIPKMMQAVWVKEPGNIDDMETRSLPVPAPMAEQVLINVAAAGINRGDIVLRDRTYPRPPTMSEILGLEASGTIVAVGEGVSDTLLGKQVCTILRGGGYAQYCVAPVETLLPVPAGLTLTEAASLAEVYCTVWSSVFMQGKLQAGETLLVHGGASGIGTAAILLGKHFGATVFVTAGSEEKCEASRKLGADLAINYKAEDFVETVAQHSANGVDVLLDVVGGDYFTRNLACMAPNGRLLCMGLMSSVKGEVDITAILFKRLHIYGEVMHDNSLAYKAELVEQLKEQVWPLFEDGSLKPVIDSVYPMDGVKEAHARMEAREHVGKIVLTMQ